MINYCFFAHVFSRKSAMILEEQTCINKNTIKLVKDKQLP